MFPLSILLIDDHAMFRSGMAMVLRSGISNIDVFEAGSLEEAMRSPIEAPAILLLDIQLQGLNGLECIGILQRKWPRVSIIMLSADATPATMRQAMERGAAAFVSKADTATNILAVIERLLRKEPAAGTPAEISGSAPSEPHLTPRQCEVLDLLCQGLPNKTIGKRLGLSENTVRGHVQALLSFLQVSSRSEAAFAARRSGLVN